MGTWLAALVWLTGLVIGGFFVAQQAFGLIVTGFGLAFGAYAWVIQRDSRNWLFWLGLALLMRLLLLWAFPLLSDDIYRFVWDGRLTIAGYHPFDHPPVWYHEQGLKIAGLDEALYQELNSPDYYTVYPPVAQGIFALATFLFPSSVWGAAVCIKLFLLLCELGSIALLLRLLHHWGQPLARVLVYALNPLVLVEGIGNLHFEVAVVFFLLLALWWLVQQQLMRAAAAWALAIASKLIPLMFLPLLIRRLGWGASIRFFVAVGIGSLLLFAPLLNSVFFSHIGRSLDLYFRQFEFNASVYYVVRWLGYAWRGHNEIDFIGPILAGCTFLLIVGLSLWERRPRLQTWPAAALLAISFYLLNGTTIHPWYLIVPVALATFTPWRYPLWWSGLATLSYIHYSYQPFHENYGIIALEYGLVGVAAWQDWRNSQRMPVF